MDRVLIHSSGSVVAEGGKEKPWRSGREWGEEEVGKGRRAFLDNCLPLW